MPDVPRLPLPHQPRLATRYMAFRIGTRMTGSFPFPKGYLALRLQGTIALATLLALAGGLLPTMGAAAAADEFFEGKIRPLLIARCYECHSTESGKREGGLALDSRQGWLRGGDSGTAIVPGNAGQSLLIRAIRYDDESLQMPPEEAGGKLSQHEIDLLTEWVARGAEDPRTTPERLGGMALDQARTWWAWQPLQRVTPPAIHSRDAHARESPEGNEIDAFLRVGWEAAALEPCGEADRYTLLRRATYDLTGLPPTPHEVAQFVADQSPAAFEGVVDRLLQSPHYGERWGRHWLDLVRYADTAGENTDHPIPDAWRYRNWVIDALNRDLPYEQFVRDQIAGDLLHAEGSADDYARGVIATGFLAIARRFDHDSDKHMHLTYEDAIDTIGRAFLGLSIACARCHDHKYDPISVQDYYAIYGILNSTRFAFPGCEAKQQPRDQVPLLPPSLWGQRTVQRAEQLARAPLPETAYAVTEGEIADAHIHLRGDPERPGDKVPRRWLQILGGQAVPADGGSGRRQLAQWLTDPANPLPARVIVNRLWQHHFGNGLVVTPNEFGSRGQRPTHPELLDWLAARFLDSGGSLKQMHRLLMTSAAYRRGNGDSATPAAATARNVDPNNYLYWRFNRRRLSAEELRDSLLAASRQLDRTPGGGHPIPDPATWSFTQHVPFAGVAETPQRSVYLLTLRNRRHPFLGLFDGADPNATTPQRQVTTVPTQSLYFLNDPFFHQQAAYVAQEVLSADAACGGARSGASSSLSTCVSSAAPTNEPPPPPPPPPTRDEIQSGRMERLYRVVLQRRPTALEQQTAATFLARYADGLREQAPADQTRESWEALARIVLSTNEFLYVD